jgi:RNA polymerase sigma factor (sigma-70 family)
MDMATAQLNTLLRHIHKLAASGGEQPRTDRQLLDDFTARRDEAAFTALLARHGPMVLRVCRRVLGHEQDAEDAFQATFVVLAQNSRSIRKREALAAWLHGVAHRTARKLQRSAARRRNHEARLRHLAPRAIPGPTWDDVQAVLDEEIQRLPAAFRAAFVLCVLEGKSGPEAAAALGIPERTVSSRLTRARHRLRQRLQRRGIGLSALVAALAVAECTGQAAVPGALVGSTLRCGLVLAAGGPVAGVIPSHIAALAAGVTRAMFLTKAMTLTAVLLAVSLSVAGAGALTYQGFAAGNDPPPPAAAAKEEPRPPARKQTPGAEDQARNSIPISGRVLDPDGKPIAGAKLYQALRVEFIEHEMPPAPKLRGTSGPDGRFQFTVAKADLAANAKAVLQVIAIAQGFGPGWVSLDKPDAQEITVRLAKDDVPITGRVLDLEARPIRGATIRPLVLMTTPNEDLTPWLQAIKDNKRFHHKEILTKQLLVASPGIPGFPQTVTTDADGRVRLTGIGRDRVLAVMIGGPKVEMQFALLVTRPGPKFQVYDNPSTDTKFMAYGASFDHIAAPSKPIAGVVRDKDTGKPLAGVRVSIDGGPFLRVVTDQEGKYQLGSLPNIPPGDQQAGFGLPVLALPPNDQPYLVGFREVKRGPGLDTTAVNFQLKRGVWVQGTVADKATGKPVRAHIQYQPSPDNPHRKEVADFTRFPSLPIDLYVTRPDGSFRVPALPGPGIITARGPYGEYLRDGSASINVTPDGAPVRCRIGLEPGRKLSGTILDPEGKPLTGVRVHNVNPRHFWSDKPLETASFTLTAVDPKCHRSLVFLHEEKHLAKVIELQGSEPNPLMVRLEPAGTITGRLVEAEGLPRPGVSCLIFFEKKDDGSVPRYFPERVKTDREGRFRVEGLAAGLRYQIIEAGKPPKDLVAVVAKGLSVRAGETKDLGDVKAKPFGE